MSQYSFPILSDKEICQCLGELGMTVSTDALSRPTPEFVQPIYEMLITALMGVTRCADRSVGGLPRYGREVRTRRDSTRHRPRTIV